MNRWYYTPDNKQRLGPVTAEQLRTLALAGSIQPEHMVMREGFNKWVPAAKVKGLFPQAQPVVEAYPTSTQNVSEPAAVTPPAKADRKELMLALAGVVLMLAFCSGVGIVGVKLSGGLKDRNVHDKSTVVSRDNGSKPSPATEVAESAKPSTDHSERQGMRESDTPQELGRAQEIENNEMRQARPRLQVNVDTRSHSANKTPNQSEENIAAANQPTKSPNPLEPLTQRANWHGVRFSV